MRKEELAKLYDHIYTTLLRQKSITGVCDQAHFLLNGVFMLYQSHMISYKDFININSYIVGITNAQAEQLIMKGRKNEKI